MQDTAGEITQLLDAVREGDGDAKSRLMAMLHRELRQMAGAYFRHERADHTLQPTALVSELYVRMVAPGDHWRNRAHFLACAARVMREILIDYSRGKSATKRGGNAVHVELDNCSAAAAVSPEDLIAVGEALDRLARDYPRCAHVVELRYFAGLTEQEIADLLGLSPKTIRRDWGFAKAWLLALLKTQSPS